MMKPHGILYIREFFDHGFYRFYGFFDHGFYRFYGFFDRGFYRFYGFFLTTDFTDFTDLEFSLFIVSQIFYWITAANAAMMKPHGIRYIREIRGRFHTCFIGLQQLRPR